jgi:predicted AAA+ superfamily ATPase
MIIKRKILPFILQAAKEFSVIAVVGPRQTGKTTLAQIAFPLHKYVSLEDYDTRTLALADPRRFLNDYPSAEGLILDEIQHAPQLLSYMQTIVDQEKKRGFYVLTGSQNFLVNESITQTLAGRIAIFTLLPLSIEELREAKLLPEQIETIVYKGMYPRIYADGVSIERLYKNYIQSYVERDVRTIKQVADLSLFQKFLALCVGRIGQVVNLTTLGNDCGITQNTVKSWLSLLESSYIIFLLHPYYKNFGKRIIKAPKLYFIDTGIACNLLQIDSEYALSNHYLRGGLIESILLADLLKQQYNADRHANLYFWRDQTGNELDGLIEYKGNPIAIEIKSGKTINSDFFKNLLYWQKITETSREHSFVVYGGSENQSWPHAEVIGWKAAGTFLEKLEKK